MKNKVKYIFMALVSLFVSTTPALAITRSCISCGDSGALPKSLATFSRNMVTAAQVLVPVIIIITGIIVLVKAVINGDDKEFANARTSLIRKIIVGVATLLIITIVKMVFSIAGMNNYLSCVACFTSSESACKEVACSERGELSDPKYTVSDPQTCSSKTTKSDCESKDGCKWNSTQKKCLSDSVASGKCYKCYNDEYVWSTTGIPSGKRDCNVTSLTKDNCKSTSSKTYYCYQCKSDKSIYAWKTSNPGKTTKCSGGYKKVSKTKEECK